MKKATLLPGDIVLAVDPVNKRGPISMKAVVLGQSFISSVYIIEKSYTSTKLHNNDYPSLWKENALTLIARKIT
jgi:hypothetical protein